MALTWKEKLGDQIVPSIGEEVDVFERQMELRKAGKMDEKVFAETRLRRGAYGQRYDNGHRHDGKEQRQLAFPTERMKGPGTYWDAPGMIRIKIPYGGVTPRQLRSLVNSPKSTPTPSCTCPPASASSCTSCTSTTPQPHASPWPRLVSPPAKPAVTPCVMSPAAHWPASARPSL